MENLLFTQSSIGGAGRLGNQLFGIFSTIGVASKFPGAKVVFPEWKYEKDFVLSSHVPGFEFGLLDPTKITHIYEEPSFHYTPFDMNNLVEWKGFGNGEQKVIDLRGYFQSPKYWEHIDERLLHSFRFSHEVEERVQQYWHKDFVKEHKHKIKKTVNPITCSLHLRFGDYVNNPYYFNLPVSDYYDRAVNLAYVKGRQLVVFVFSDDNELAEKAVDTIKRGVPPDVLFYVVRGLSDIESMFVMSHCEVNIIANSSFSWWSSYLNRNSDKQVIAPRNWFAGEGLRNDTRDLYFEGMTVI